MMRFLLSLPVVILVVAAMSAARAEQTKNIEDFYGSYVGQSISVEGEGLTPRDLSVKIKSAEGGFNVSWTTITKRVDGTKRKKSYSIDFAVSKRKGIYSSAMRRDMFGNRRPIDPLAGGVPFVWATLKGSSLTVHALLITDDGGYELQSYVRTLTDEGLRLEFNRFRNGKAMRTITGELKRQK